MQIMTFLNMKTSQKIFLFALTILLASCTSVPTREQIINADHGPYPENHEQRIRDYFSNILRDPYSAQYRFHKPFKGYTNKAPILGGGVEKFGWIVRVWVNAKNAFGGYVGEKQYMFFFKNGIMQETGYLSSYHTPYFADPAEQFADKGRIGIAIDKDGFVLDVAENSPAFTAGIRKGDKLTKVEDQNLQENNVADVTKEIIGEPGSKVKLTITRDNKELYFEIERQIIK